VGHDADDGQRLLQPGAQTRIVFPAAILQPPFFDPNADDAVNYGGIGAVIGHEISHGFDDQGSQYDATGALKNWWTKDDTDKFKTATAKLVAQYSAYCPLPAADGKPAQCVKGELTLGENIADLAGLTISYNAYKLSLGRQASPGARRPDRRSAVLPWLSLRSGADWTGPRRPPNRLVTDPHSPRNSAAPWSATSTPGTTRSSLKRPKRSTSRPTSA